ncbi:MAG: S9 family peptidase [Pseudomonadales bacterium]|nr:S9 family peptidase [Pseudomonadales bacterium]
MPEPLARHIRLGVVAMLTWAAILSAPVASAKQLTLERLFAAPDISGPTLRSPRISPDGKLVAYLRGSDDDKDRYDLWAYDTVAQQHRRLIDSRALAGGSETVSVEEAARRERQRTAALSGIVDYQFAPDSRTILVPLNGDLYLYDLRAPESKAVRQLTTTAAAETDAKFSPRGRYVSYIREQNLYVTELRSGVETAVTRGGGELVSFGMAEFIAQEEMDRDTGYWWSPDDKRIAVARVDETPVAELERFEIYAENVRVIKQRYPATGAANALVTLGVYTLDGNEVVPIDLGPNQDIYLARVDWFPSADALAVQRQSRNQQTLDLLRADAATGATQTLLTERSATWVPLHHELTFLKRSPRFIWSSVRDGYKHLYLYHNDGTLIRQLTTGDWMVVGDSNERAISALDERAGRVYFMANKATPLERHLYWTELEKAGAEPVRITAGSGWHSVKMAETADLFVDTFSTANTPPQVSLRDQTGALLTTLVANELNANHPYAPYFDEHARPEFGSLRAEDGQTIYYKLIKPRGTSSGKRFPVIVDVYGGPAAQRVQRAWGSLFQQYLAQQGFVVFALDNRGSGFRGTEFESALFHRMGTVEVRDQMKGVEFLRSLPYVDPQRIGIWGWSYGGYMALMCLMQAPEHFAAAAAGAPVTDWRLYDTHYTERYMGTPVDDAAAYEKSDVLNHADQLRGSLLVLHGMADDNVLFTHSTALMKRLQDLQKPFDLMTYPGSKHGLIRQSGTGQHAYSQIERFFKRTLAPVGD